MNQLWYEKYKPKNINDIIQHNDIKNIFTKNIKTQNIHNIPHLLLYGNPGTGKTCSAIAICKKIFSNNSKILNERILELNASNDRGIKIIREKIKTFASYSINNYDNVSNVKIIILDEADILTNDSQFALRRIIEQYSHITRFILICNYITKIILPLISRCAKYKFNDIEYENIEIVLNNILNNENIIIENKKDIYNNIYNFTKGDLRKSIIILQKYCYNMQNNITLNINDITCDIPDSLVLILYNSIKKLSENYNEIIKNLKYILYQGYIGKNILNKLTKLILSDSDITDITKSKIFINISNVENLLTTNSTDYIQLLALCTFTYNCIHYND